MTTDDRGDFAPGPGRGRARSAARDARRVRMFVGAPGLSDFGGEFGPAVAADPAEFRARLISMDLAAVELHKITATAHVGVLCSALGRAAPTNVARFVFTVAGTADTADRPPARVDPLGGVRPLTAADAVPFNATTTTTLFVVDAPMLALPSLLDAVRRGAAQPTIRPNAVTSATIAFLESTLNLAVPSGSDDVFHIERALTALLASVANSGSSSPVAEPAESAPSKPESSIDDLTFERANALIVAESHRPELSIADLAERLGTSPRSLQRLFAKRDLSVSEAIRNVRLDALAARLTEPDSTASVAALVAATGFGAIDYARRAFVQRFGVSMSHYRRGERKP